MKGIALEFKQRVQASLDELNNPVYDIVGVTVEDCLIAPILEPRNDREQQAMEQMRDQIRIHLPKTFTGHVANSFVAWNGKIFQIDSDSVIFMNENTPTRWNRYFRGESVGQYDENEPDVWLHFFVTEDSQNYLSQEAS